MMQSARHRGEGSAGYGVLGMGMYVPQRVSTNAEIGAAAGVTEEWIVEKTGVLERRRAATGRTPRTWRPRQADWP
ncbi:hypothetical protein P9209_23075 [Prescottella defluvii]|nr:hypothetical protein P9209_23075 [Prescottella defluvii]